MEGGSRAAAVEPACHVLEDGSRVADDDSRTADEERAASTGSRANWLADVCRVVVQKNVPSEVIRNRRFFRTTYKVGLVRRFTYVLYQTLTTRYIQSTTCWLFDCSNTPEGNNVQLSSLRQEEFSHMRSNINQHVLFRSRLQGATGPPDDCHSRREKRTIV